MAHIYLNNPLNPPNIQEYLTIKIGIALNFGWVTCASILSIAICFKKFQTNFGGYDEICAIIVLCIAACIFLFDAIINGGFLYSLVFVYFNMTLFARYNSQSTS